MEIAGYFGAILIGVSLGLVGGGGSILTVPILVYLFNIDPLLATSYSLFIVGITSAAGALKNVKGRQVDTQVALLFGSSSIVTVLLIRLFLLPLIPEYIATIGTTVVTRSFVIMVLFALLMLLAAGFILRSPKDDLNRQKQTTLPILLYGVLIGVVTGLLGAGGGFLLIPALVMLVKLPMKKAVGTSLTIIAATSLIGFAGDVQHHSINWIFLVLFSLLAIAGVFTGIYMGRRIAGYKLKKSFGWFLVLTGLLILVAEFVAL